MCFLWFHKWGPWGKPKRWVCSNIFSARFIIEVQQRVCLKCGCIQEREIEPW